MKTVQKPVALIAAGLGFLYFAHVFSATGIFVAGRSRVAVSAASDPDGFALRVGLTAAIGAASVLAGAIMMLRR